MSSTTSSTIPSTATPDMSPNMSPTTPATTNAGDSSPSPTDPPTPSPFDNPDLDHDDLLLLMAHEPMTPFRAGEGPLLRSSVTPPGGPGRLSVVMRKIHAQTRSARRVRAAADRELDEQRKDRALGRVVKKKTTGGKAPPPAPRVLSAVERERKRLEMEKFIADGKAKWRGETRKGGGIVTGGSR